MTGSTQQEPSRGPASTDWARVDNMPEFRELMAAKVRFIVPATIFFIVYYFALPVLVGYAPKFMDTPVIGPVNIAYLFALSQFFMAWILAWIYMRVADKWDARARDILRKLDASNKLDASKGVR
jgi:uncharacterized membrane protein (DUF485 family)